MGLRILPGPDTCTKSELRRRALETDHIERKIVRLAPTRTLLVAERTLSVIPTTSRSATAVHKRQGEGHIQVRLGREDLRILDKVLPFNRVQLLEVLEERNPRIRVALLDNLAQAQQDLQPHPPSASASKPADHKRIPSPSNAASKP